MMAVIVYPFGTEALTRAFVTCLPGDGIG
jgi:hypothetical protein